MGHLPKGAGLILLLVSEAEDLVIVLPRLALAQGLSLLTPLLLAFSDMEVTLRLPSPGTWPLAQAAYPVASTVGYNLSCPLTQIHYVRP